MITPETVTIGSKKKIWWKCSSGHKWESYIKSRVRGDGCPYCANKRVNQENCLSTTHPELAKEWHPTKNGDLTPYGLISGSHKKVWWKCVKGHEWKAEAVSRKAGRGCPYCINKMSCKDNCLATINPELAKEWHPTKNGDLTAFDITDGSGKVTWWICKEGHEWDAMVKDRRKQGCPYCANKKVNKENCLSTTNPKLAKQWHPTKNGDLKPFDITGGSNKKAWWICEGKHEWETHIFERGGSRRNGCPYCSGYKVSVDNCLSNKNPELAKEWHPTKNGDLKPFEVTWGSSKKVWWKCKKGHEWETTVGDRSKGRRCPYCSGRYVNKENCLAVMNPELAKEWHPTKNGQLTPYDVMCGSSKKVWWICSKAHEWEAMMGDRSKGSGCPHCYNLRRRKNEQLALMV